LLHAYKDLAAPNL